MGEIAPPLPRSETVARAAALLSIDASGKKTRCVPKPEAAFNLPDGVVNACEIVAAQQRFDPLPAKAKNRSDRHLLIVFTMQFAGADVLEAIRKAQSTE